MTTFTKPNMCSKNRVVILGIFQVILLSLFTAECEAQSLPDRCFVDHESQMVFKVPAIKSGSWFRGDQPQGSIILSMGPAHSLDFTLNISASAKSNIESEIAQYIREQELYEGIYVYNGFQKWKAGTVETLSKGYTANGYRIIEHRLFFNDKTVSIQLSCKEGKFEEYHDLLERIKESILPFDPKFESKIGKTSGKQGMSFIDKQLGIQVQDLPHINARQNVKLMAFSIFRGKTFNTVVSAESIDTKKKSDLRDTFLEHVDGPPISNMQSFSDSRIEWKSKDRIVTDTDDASIKHCARIQIAFNDVDAILCLNVLDISEADLDKEYSGIPPWEEMGGSFPLAKLRKDE